MCTPRRGKGGDARRPLRLSFAASSFSSFSKLLRLFSRFLSILVSSAFRLRFDSSSSSSSLSIRFFLSIPIITSSPFSLREVISLAKIFFLSAPSYRSCVLNFLNPTWRENGNERKEKRRIFRGTYYAIARSLKRRAII